MVPESHRKEKNVTDSTKFIKTKKRLLDIFRPTGTQPIDETPAPEQSKFEQELNQFNEYLERAGQRE